MNPSGRNPYDPSVRSLATDLLGHRRQKGGTVPSEFNYALFDLWSKADEADKKIIEGGWPLVGFVLRAGDKGGAPELRSIAGISNS